MLKSAMRSISKMQIRGAEVLEKNMVRSKEIKQRQLDEELPF